MTGRATPSVPHLPQVLPTARAILWNPMLQGTARRTPGGAYPIFIDQKALTALNDHFTAIPSDQAVFGFLAGDLFECPTSKVRYAVVDSTIRLNQPIYGDKTAVVVQRLWDRIQDELKKIEGQLIGWYHSHPGLPLSLAPEDVRAQETHFTSQWHTALVLGHQGNDTVAGFFRRSGASAWTTTPLPFYELLDEGTVSTRGKRSILPWKNFGTDEATVSRPAAGSPPRVGPPPKPATPAPPQPKLPPQAPAPKPAAPKAPAPPPPPPPPTPPPPPPSPPRPAPEAPMTAPTIAPPSRLPADAMVVESSIAPSMPPPPPPSAPALPAPAPLSPPPASSAPRRSGSQSTPSLEPLHHPERMSTPVRSSTRRPTVGKLYAKPSRGWTGRIVLGIVILALLGGAGYWYQVLRPTPGWEYPWTPLVRRFASAKAPAPAPVPQATVLDSATIRFDQASDSLAAALTRFGDRALRFGGTANDCPPLDSGLIALEDAWTTYSQRQQNVALDATRAARDQQLSSSADSSEATFESSGCERP
jgi:proteasome lid subunit RPN8/RPN11